MCPLFFWSFLKVSPVEAERKDSPSWGQTAGPKAGQEGRLVGRDHPLSPRLSPQALPGPLSWHLGIWNLFIWPHTIPSGIQGHKKRRESSLLESGSLPGKSVRREGRESASLSCVKVLCCYGLVNH